MSSTVQKWKIEILHRDRYLSESLAMANALVQQGKADEAVRFTGEALVYLLNLSLPLTQEQLEKLKKLPRIGVELGQSGKKLELVYHKQNFNILEASTLLRFFFGLLDTEKQLWLWARFLRYGRGSLVRWLDGLRDRFCVDIYGNERRQLCWTLTALKHRTAVKPEGYKNYFKHHCLQLSAILREPIQRTTDIVKLNAVELDLMEHRRNRRRIYREISQYRKLFRWRRKLDYMTQVNTDKRSLIVAAFHFGDFFHALNYLADHGAGDRNRLVLQYQDGSVNSRANAATELGHRQLGRYSQLLSQQADPLALVASLRQGNTSLTIFCDLPQEHGQVVEVSFLGRRAWFPKGPAQIALLSKAPLMPFITYNDGDCNIIEISSLIEPDMEDGESLQQATVRLTQCLISFLESHFKRYPEQWRYLNKLPSYFVTPSDMDAQPA